jgi:deoxyribonucleoside regulator
VAYDEHLTVKIATLYYLKQLGQEEIAEKLCLSRQSVGRHLQHAKKRKIVEFTIHSPLSCCSELECRLEARFGLHEAVVVRIPFETDEAVKAEIGKAAAVFLERRVIPGDIIGVSWSSTVFACAGYLKKKPVERVKVVQLNGSMDRARYSTRAEHIIEKIAAAFHADPVTMAAPMLVDSPRILKTLLDDSRIRATFDLAKRSSIAVFGIGGISQESSLYKTGYMDDALLEDLLVKRAVGDICGHFFDALGNICDKKIDECLLSVSRENMREKRLSVGIAGGTDKVDALRGALNGGWCNVLITDEKTAEAILTQGKNP